jgi:PTS system N-acetylglucosamine-specific IIC component
MNALQPLGRALMLPIAVLPVAGLLLRLGQPDLLNIGFVSAAGDAIFSNLGLLFALGVATGFARDGNGAACLAGVVCFLVARSGAEALMIVPPDGVQGFAGAAADLAAAAWKQKAIAKLEVPIGILSGLAGGLLYNRFSTIRLPEYLAFFGGRRFVPIVAGVVGLVLALFVGIGFPLIDAAINRMSYGLASSGALGLFLFGLFNRLLLVTGLHHILNNVVWFVLGSYGGANGDLRRFFAGDPAAGAFMAGFFPVMMFGLPAACLAMYHCARPDRRKAVGGMLLSLSLTSLLTGVTEPIEFSFMFLAPALYAVHAVLTGAAMVVMNALGVRLGFGFSAGLLDYLLNFGKSTRPLLLVPVGAVYAVLYYALFRYLIVRLDLPTPGRERDAPAAPEAVPPGERGLAFVAALGGRDNLTSIGACTTRLRLIVADQALIDMPRLKALGARGVLRPSPTAVQVVLGPIADQVAVEIRQAASAAEDAGHAPVAMAIETVDPLADRLIEALGGSANITGHQWRHGRIRVWLHDADLVAPEALARSGIRQIAATAPGRLHLLFAPADRDRLQG